MKTTPQKPPFTPVEAKALFKGNFDQTLQHKGFTLEMEGIAFSLPETWSPEATDAHGNLWSVTGEPGSPIDGETWTLIAN